MTEIETLRAEVAELRAEIASLRDGLFFDSAKPRPAMPTLTILETMRGNTCLSDDLARIVNYVDANTNQAELSSGRVVESFDW